MKGIFERITWAMFGCVVCCVVGLRVLLDTHNTFLQRQEPAAVAEVRADPDPVANRMQERVYATMLAEVKTRVADLDKNATIAVRGVHSLALALQHRVTVLERVVRDDVGEETWKRIKGQVDTELKAAAAKAAKRQAQARRPAKKP